MTLTALSALTCLSASAIAADSFQLAWDHELDTTYGNAAYDVAADGDGNVYVCGEVGTSSVLHDWIVIKYDAAGAEQWSDVFDGPAAHNDSARHVRIDSAGNAYVAGISFTGGSFGEGPKYDIVVRKYTPAGDVAWSHTFNSVNDNDDFIEDVVVRPDGSVFVVGLSYAPIGELSDADYVVYRLSPDGELMWWRFWDGPFDAIYWTAARAAADDAGLAIAATTERWIGPDDSDDLTIFSFVRFSPVGDEIAEGYWQPPFNEQLPDTNWLSDAALDHDGNMIAVGRYDGPSSFDTGPEEPARAVAIKFAPDGEVVWTAENDTERSDVFDRVAVDAQGNVFLSGSYNVEGNVNLHAEHLTAAYDAGGGFIWEHRFGGEGELFDGEGFAAIDSAGDLIIATGYYGEPFNENVRLLRYDRMTGAVMDSWQYDQGTANDRILGLALDPSDDVLLAGWSRDYTPQGGFENASLMIAKVRAGSEPPLTGDVDGNGTVDVDDLVALLLAWGGASPDADLNGDGVVDVDDLVLLILNWS